MTAARRVAELIGLRAGDTRRLSQQDFRSAGARHGVEAAALHAFADIESGTSGFTPDGRLVPLFEPHLFSRETRGQYDGQTIDGVCISYPKWVPAGGKLAWGQRHAYTLSFVDRWSLIAFAADLDFEGALRATSWGAFQILGKWAQTLGHASAWHFVVSLYEGERAHLDAALAYLAANDALDAMRSGDWRKVVTVWNGPGQVDAYLAKFERRLIERRKSYA